MVTRLTSAFWVLIAPSALRCTCQRDSESNSWVLTPVGAPVANSLGSPIFPSGCEGKLGVALELDLTPPASH